MRRTVAIVAAGLFVLALSGCGGSRGEVRDLTGSKAADEQAAAPTVLTGGAVDVAMDEFSFTPAKFTVKKGTAVRFHFVNHGKVEHEAVVGDMDAQMEHAAEMGNGGHHDEAMGEGATPEIELEPGKAGTLDYTFDQPGEFLIGCHVPGHWDAGMKATITVTA
jgi:uncharacterized cupredoxin-like copper-binding protein